jgi:hypothetical protein
MNLLSSLLTRKMWSHYQAFEKLLVITVANSDLMNSEGENINESVISSVGKESVVLLPSFEKAFSHHCGRF